MAGKYREITSKEHNGWLRGCPIQIDNTQLLSDEEDRVLLRAKACNLSEKIITEIRFAVECFDETGGLLGVMPDVAFTELKAYPHTDFGTDRSVYLAFSKTADYNIFPSAVVFEDGSKWENTEKKKPAPMSVQEKIDKDSEVGKFIAAVSARDGVRIKYWADIKEEYWRCTCGQANPSEADICCRCTTKKAHIFKFFNKATIDSEKADFDKTVEQIYNEVTKGPKPKTEEDCEAAILKLLSIKDYKDVPVWITRFEDLRAKLRIKEIKKITGKEMLKIVILAAVGAAAAFGITFLVLHLLGMV